jgi:hypothetical protein
MAKDEAQVAGKSKKKSAVQPATMKQKDKKNSPAPRKTKPASFHWRADSGC